MYPQVEKRGHGRTLRDGARQGVGGDEQPRGSTHQRVRRLGVGDKMGGVRELEQWVSRQHEQRFGCWDSGRKGKGTNLFLSF